MTTLYGINNCDTVKKAKKWLDSHGIEYEFYDYKKQAPSVDFLKEMLEKHGLDTIVNKRGTTYRKLSQEEKDSLSITNAPELLVNNSSIIKRPILVRTKDSHVGFSPALYSEIFGVA
jgi:arsenate reductase